MVKVGISKLKNGLSRYLQVVRKGEEVEVLDRKLPIARIVPIEAPDRASTGEKGADRAFWEEQVRKGVIRPPAGKFPKSLLRLPPGKPGALAGLLEERRRSRR